jgi:hypothetical protein
MLSMLTTKVSIRAVADMGPKERKNEVNLRENFIEAFLA